MKKDFYNWYFNPKDERLRKFLDLHKIVPCEDPYGNDYTAGVKYNKRKEERHGYDSPSDAAVYEDTSWEGNSEKASRYADTRRGKRMLNVFDKAQRRKRGLSESVESLDEGKATPYVKPHIEKGSATQSGWKASNKHGKVKYFGMDFKDAAKKHAGLNEISDELRKRYIEKADDDIDKKLIANPSPDKMPKSMSRKITKRMQSVLRAQGLDTEQKANRFD